MRNLSSMVKNISLKKKQRGNYFIFKENNQKDEVKSGKKINGSWEIYHMANSLCFMMLTKLSMFPPEL